jgi:hypothetical protein
LKQTSPVGLDNREFQDDPWFCACEMVHTIDEATQQAPPRPRDHAYLEALFAALGTERLLAVPKSRRMMGSWAVSAWATHRILGRGGASHSFGYDVYRRCKHFIQPDPRIDSESGETKRLIVS